MEKSLDTFNNFIIKCGYLPLQRESVYSLTIRKVISYFIVIYQILNCAKTFLYISIFIGENDLEKLLLGDFLSLMHPHPYVKVCVAIGYVNNISICLLYHLSPKSHFKWVNVFLFIQGKLTKRKIHINHHHSSRLKYIFQQYIKLFKKFEIFYDGVHCMGIMLVTIKILYNYNITDISLIILVIFHIINQIFHGDLVVYTVAINSFIFFVVCFYCQLRAKEFNNEFNVHIKQTDYLTDSRLTTLLSKHNRVCLTIRDFNKFYSKFYFIFITTLIPGTILAIPAMMKMNLFWFSVFVIPISTCWSLIFIVTFLTARLTKMIHEPKMYMLKLQFKLKADQIESKIKLLSTYERITDTKNIIGFSVLNLFVMNFPRFGSLVLMYCRFLMLIFKMEGRM